MAKKYVEGEIIQRHFPNKSVVEAEDGTRVVVKGGLPGQKVGVRITRNRKDNKKGKIVELLAPSPMEEAADCPHAAICGGCTYQSLSYEKESALKKAMIDDLYGRDVPYTPAPREYHYRNKMEYTFGDAEKGGPLTLGLHHKKGFYDIVSTAGCLLVPEDMETIRAAVEGYFRELNTPFYHRMKHEGTLRFLVVRHARATDSYLVNLVTTSDAVDEAAFVDFLRGLKLKGTVASIYRTITDDWADAIKPEEVRHLYGEEVIGEELLDLHFDIGPFSFFQPNPDTATLIYEKARALAAEEKGVVFDLYSGTGTIGQVLAKAAKKVVGIEIVESAVEDANRSAARNGIDNARFIAGDVLEMIDTVDEACDLLVVDPPRDGIHPKAIEKLAALGARRILYISCNPVTQVRDIEILEAKGYKVQHLEAVDQFPRTAHVETVALLSKLDVDKHINIEIELDELDLTSAESKATYAQIKEYVWNKFELKVSTLYIAQIKRKCGIELREHYNKSKRRNQLFHSVHLKKKKPSWML
ncbi:23S rRNA (uracil(1939)-C(5))-methyltransferase RlmD [Peptoniphilus sp. HCN-40583]|uniref:23S rRNA (uracil(1939)-C(5))-methyltransferase RlmD n=1 Tax=Peptoniphilus sp. HCN-40583 TaxID=3134662 RepID=UPI0030BEFBCD